MQGESPLYGKKGGNMEAIGRFLPTFPQAISGKRTNKYFLIAEEIARLTGDTPLRWVRDVKQHPWAAETALRVLKERIKSCGKPKNVGAYYTMLFKKYKEGRC
jgi:hypothetical protein